MKPSSKNTEMGHTHEKMHWTSIIIRAQIRANDNIKRLQYIKKVYSSSRPEASREWRFYSKPHKNIHYRRKAL